MYNSYKKTNIAIEKNDKVIGKPMSMAQLDTLIKLTCRYEWEYSCRLYDVKQASGVITAIMDRVANDLLKERENCFNFDQLKVRFISKHPGIYQEIQMR
jgi:hypothetical protein